MTWTVEDCESVPNELVPDGGCWALRQHYQGCWLCVAKNCSDARDNVALHLFDYDVIFSIVTHVKRTEEEQ